MYCVVCVAVCVCCARLPPYLDMSVQETMEASLEVDEELLATMKQVTLITLTILITFSASLYAIKLMFHNNIMLTTFDVYTIQEYGVEPLLTHRALGMGQRLVTSPSHAHLSSERDAVVIYNLMRDDKIRRDITAYEREEKNQSLRSVSVPNTNLHIHNRSSPMGMCCFSISPISPIVTTCCSVCVVSRRAPLRQSFPSACMNRVIFLFGRLVYKMYIFTRYVSGSFNSVTAGTPPLSGFSLNAYSQPSYALNPGYGAISTPQNMSIPVRHPTSNGSGSSSHAPSVKDPRHYYPSHQALKIMKKGAVSLCVLSP